MISFQRAFKRLREIPLILDKSFFVLLILLPFANFLFGGLASGVQTFLILPSVFLFALLHEYGHCLAALHYGFPVEEVRLWFLGGQATIQNLESTTAKEEAVISIAGPAVNFLLALLFLPLGFLIGFDIIAYPVILNLVLGIFNLIPAYPMDGGRILRSLLFAVTKNKYKATILTAYIGIAVSVTFFILALAISNFMMMAVFVWIGSICCSILKNRNAII